MKGLRYAILLIMLLISAPRSMAQRIEFGGFERVTHLSTSGANLWVEVENRGCWRMVVKEAEVDILVDGTPRLTLALRDKVVVPRKSSSEVLVPLRFRSRSMLSFAGLVARIALGDREDITINYRIKAGTPLFKRRFEQEGVPLNQLMQLLSLHDGEIESLNMLLK
ncbi:MAG: LEA type 2 family protein [Alistipes sp.]|nr:LEA type 2 family protein [Alistipes sp.]